MKEQDKTSEKHYIMEIGNLSEKSSKAYHKDAH